jgi:anti-sigma B factor antagonist
MQMSKDTRDDVTVVRFEGNLDTNTSEEAQKYLNQTIDDGAAKIVVTFDNVDFVSSAGLRILLATAKRLSGSGGSLRICGLNETVAEVFEISGFNTILDVSATESDAVAGF